MMHVASKWRRNSNSFNVVNENGQHDDATVASNQLSIACANYKHFCDILYLFQVSFSSIRVIGVFVFSLRHFARWSAQKHLFNEKKYRTFAFASENCFARFFHAITTQCKLADYQVDGKKLKTTKLPMNLFEMRVFFTLWAISYCVVKVCCNLAST